MIVVLDAGPLGLTTNPRPSLESRRCNAWLDDLLADGQLVVIPEIADYEVRREILRVGRQRGIHRLDQLKAALVYAPITTSIMLQAARLWAEARRRGQPTADDRDLDADVILAAQARALEDDFGQAIIVATTNVVHIAWFVDARIWTDIP